MQQVEQFKKALKSVRRVVITTHHKPDADALGSSLGLAGYLKKKGIECTVIAPTDYPDFLNWMQGNDDVIVFNEGDNPQKTAILMAEADMIFCLDFSSLDRINELGELVRDAKGLKVLIDHHLEPEHFADFEFWSIEAAATAELVYDLISALGDKSEITAEIGECLYAGIMTDTGQFKHSNTTQHVHQVTGELVCIGVNVNKVAQLIYDSNTIDRLRFLGYALAEKLVIIEDCHTAYFSITKDELRRFNSKTGDTEGLVNYALSINGIIMAAVIIDRTEAVKMSFRSRGNFSVNKFAREYFNGGGHKNAAGGRSDKNLTETVAEFEKHVKQNKTEILKEVIL